NLNDPDYGASFRIVSVPLQLPPGNQLGVSAWNFTLIGSTLSNPGPAGFPAPPSFCPTTLKYALNAIPLKSDSADPWSVSGEFVPGDGSHAQLFAGIASAWFGSGIVNVRERPSNL